MRIKSTTLLIVLFLAHASLSVGVSRTVSAATSEYTITDIGTLVGQSDGQFDVLEQVIPTAMTNSGLVVANGISSSDSGWSVPFASEGGSVKRFGREKAISHAYDVNEQGIVVGETTDRGDTELTNIRPVVWNGSELTELPTLGGATGSARAINDQGAVVGYSAVSPESGGGLHATYWEGGQVFDLGTLGGESSIAHDINESGVIAGAAVRTAIRTRPVVWQNGVIRELPLPEFWVAGEALAINDNGVIVGGGYREFAESPMRWIDGAYEELPGFEERATGAARDVNNDGVVVGKVYLQKNGYADDVAVRWDESGLVNLNDLIVAESGFVLIDAVSINDSGQILVIATRDGIQHGLVMTPAGSSAQLISSAQTIPVADFRRV